MNKIKYLKKEISYIKDKNKKKDIEILINLLPEYFFNIPLSIDTDIYPKYVTTNNGLIKYTKACIKIAIDMFNTVNNFADDDKDLIIMALIMCKGMYMGSNGDKVKKDYPLLVSKLIMENTAMLEMEIDDIRKLCMMIESHLGNTKNNKIDLPTPVNEIQRYVYRCNYLASRKYINIKFNKLDIID